MRGFATDTGGVTAIEYTLIASLISVVIFSAMSAIGQSLVRFFAALAVGFR